MPSSIEMLTNEAGFFERIGGGLCPPEIAPDEQDPGPALVRSEGGPWGTVCARH